MSKLCKCIDKALVEMENYKVDLLFILQSHIIKTLYKKKMSSLIVKARVYVQTNFFIMQIKLQIHD